VITKYNTTKGFKRPLKFIDDNTQVIENSNLTKEQLRFYTQDPTKKQLSAAKKTKTKLHEQLKAVLEHKDDDFPEMLQEHSSRGRPIIRPRQYRQ